MNTHNIHFMNTHNIYFHDRIRKIPYNIPKYLFLLELSEEFPIGGIS